MISNLCILTLFVAVVTGTSSGITQEELYHLISDMSVVLQQQAKLIAGQSKDISLLQHQYAAIAQNKDNGQIAFTATASEDRTYNAGETIQFFNVLTNMGGAYNANTGIFKCPVHGVYLFSSTIFTHNDNAMLFKITSSSRGEFLYGDSAPGYNQSTAGIAVVECAMDEEVQVQVRGNGNRLLGGLTTSFTGTLLSILATS